MRRSAAFTAAVAAGCATALPAGGTTVAQARHLAAPRVCTAAPRAVRFARIPHRPAGVISWAAPRSLPAGAGGYRVFHNGKVSGQTPLRTRRMRIAFRPGKPLRLLVRVALRSGRLAPCGAHLTLVPKWVPPGTPRDLSARAEDDAVSLDWQPSTRGDGVLNGYRVVVDGRVSRQVRTTGTTLRLPPLRLHTIAVAAVDTQGAVSLLSNTVQVTPGHSAPTVPADVSAAAVGPTGIRVAWSPSTASGGARLFYRVLRGGRTVGQTADAAFVVGNLAPATSYTFTVVAVDSLGYSSAESVAAAAATNAPDRTTGAVHAFLLASTGASFRDLQAHYLQIGTIYPTYQDCLGNGTFVGNDDSLVTGWARLRGIRVEARYNCQSTAVLHALLTDPGAEQTLISQMVSQATAAGWDGVNVDFEAGAPADRDAFSSFVTAAAAALHGAGKTLSVDVSAKSKDVKNHPRSTFYDYDALAAQADTLFVMCWGIHWRTSGPGATDDWTWATQVAAYVAARPNRAKYVLGWPMYGFDWPAGGGAANPATPLEWTGIQSLLAQTGASAGYDGAQHAPHFSYTDGSGAPHDVWYADGQSVGERIALAHQTGVGVGLWRLGEEDPAVWANPLIAPGASW